MLLAQYVSPMRNTCHLHCDVAAATAAAAATSAAAAATDSHLKTIASTSPRGPWSKLFSCMCKQFGSPHHQWQYRLQAILYRLQATLQVEGPCGHRPTSKGRY